MAPEFRLKRARNGKFYIHWTDPGPRGRRGRSRRVSTRTADPEEADLVFEHFSATRTAGGSSRTKCPLCGAVKNEPLETGDALLARTARKYGINVPTGFRPVIAELWHAYTERHVKPKTVAPGAVKSIWQNLKQHFGSLPASEVNEDVVDRYVEARVTGHIGGRPCLAHPDRPWEPTLRFPAKLSTVRRELIGLKACFNWCIRRKILRAEEVWHFELPPDGGPRDRWLTLEEHQRLLTAAAEMRRGDRLSRAERFLWLAHETGARKTAICQLTWHRVDFETNVIDFNVPGRRKTKKRRAAVPISKTLRPVLERIRDERLPGCDLVMDTEVDVWETINSAARRAKVVGVSPHVLRHTAATHMARRGVPIFIIAKVLAITVATAERVYAKHSPEDLREAVDKISEGVVGPNAINVTETGHQQE